ncbi:MAG: hypothetical protein Q7K55_07635 [Candidatus Levybacteria bacterium]|nr:hypothetical protein [Candidatus Levybacteria bacterium]
MKRSISFLTFLTGIIIFLGVVQVTVSNRLSTAGLEIAKLQEETKKYNNENSIMSESLLLSTSLTNIASTAAEIGFVKSGSQFFLSTPLPLAVKQ